MHLALDTLRVRAELVEVGPTVPFDFAAWSVWQLPQPALAKTFAPGSELVDELELSFPLPPQPARARTNEAQESRAADGRCTHAPHSSEGLRRVESNRTGLGLSPAAGYSLTLVGVVEKQPVPGARLSWRSRSLDELVPLGLSRSGSRSGALSLLIYIVGGYSHGMLWLWLGGLVVAAVGFGLRARVVAADRRCSTSASRPGSRLLCSPLYLIALYRWPVQVSSDEVAIMTVSKQYAHEPAGDPFGVSFYLTRPALPLHRLGQARRADRRGRPLPHAVPARRSSGC